MKKLLLLLSLISLTIYQGVAQDIITKRTGEAINAKVLEITPSEVKYKKFESQSGPTYIIAKADILLIQYEDKTSEVFELPQNSPANVTASTETDSYVKTASAASTAIPVQLYNKGQADATMYYDGYKAAGTAVLVASLVSPLVALIPAIATSSTPPKSHNLDAPNHQLLQDPDYVSGYRKSARKVKSGKVWKNWAIGFGANLIAVLLLANS